MTRGPAQRWNRNVQEIRLQPENTPSSIRDSVYDKVNSSLFKFYNMFDDVLIKNQNGMDIEIKNSTDVYKIAQSMSALTRAGIEIERWEFEKQRRIEDVAGQLLLELKMALGDEPEVYQKLLPLMDRAVAAVKDQYTAKEENLPAIDIE
jgi:hypothetical protein